MKLSGPVVFVVGIWLALTVAAAGYVVVFAAADPFGDEWDLVPGVTFQTPLRPWLWEQHNEHRLPLPKLVYTWLMQLGGIDARGGGLATVAVLSGLSLALVRSARALRGRTEYADAFIPIAFLNWGHFENFLIGFQISFALSVALAIGWLLSSLDWIERREPAALKWMGLCLLGLPLCGAHGLVYVPPCAAGSIWLSRAAPRWARASLALMAALSLALTALYFSGYQKPVAHPVSRGVGPSLVIAIETLSLAIGWCGQMTWPVSGALVIGFIVVMLGLLGFMLRTDPDRAIAFAAVGSGAIVLAVGIGWGRSGFGPLAGFAVRYALLMLPLVVAGYLAWVRSGGSLVPMAMFTVAVLFLTQHGRTGLAEGRLNREMMATFAEDVRAGLSPEEVARRNPKLYPNPEILARRIRTLQAARVPRYLTATPGVALQSP